MKKILFVIAILTAIFTFTACDKNEQADIYTTIYPIHYLTTQIAGDEITVQNILPVGADAHAFEPTSKQIINISNAKALFAMGNYEFYFENLESTLENEDVKIIELAHELEDHDHEINNITLSNDHDNHDEHDHDEIHAWLDMENMIHLGEIITAELEEIYPNKADTFETNLIALSQKLIKLENKMTTLHEEVTFDHFVITHAAYDTWEKYGLHQKPIQGIDSHSEPSTAEIEALIDYVSENNIKHIFFEQNIQNKYGDTIANATGATKLELHNLSNLTQTDIDNDDDFISLMEKNIEALKKGLTINT